jgi:hypothetical protein
MPIYSPLPQTGDEVRLQNLVSARELNGKTGTVEDFVAGQGRYQIKLPDQKKIKALKSDNIEIVKQRPLSSFPEGMDRRIHVLIPCHIESHRRLATFMRCMRSVMGQTYYGFDVIISLSGPTEFCKAAKDSIFRGAALHLGARWHVDDTGLERKAQMEHMRGMVELSSAIDPQASLLFLDNDDMFHPMRLELFHQVATDMEIPDGAPFPLGCKLLLNEDIAPDEGTLERLVAHSQDFDKWSRDAALRGKVQLAVTSQCDELDATEYFDYMVPTAVMEQFFRLNPPAMTSHKYCDLRLLRIFETLSPIEVQDHPVCSWLIAHYKTTMDSKLRTFDNHGDTLLADYGRNSEASNHQSFDQISTKIDAPSATDVALAEKYGSLTPGQVRMCRQHISSVVIQFIGWDDTHLKKACNDKVKELNGLHGIGFGDDLWIEVEIDLQALLGNVSNEESKGAWVCMFPTE